MQIIPRARRRRREKCKVFWQIRLCVCLLREIVIAPEKIAECWQRLTGGSPWSIQNAPLYEIKTRPSAILRKRWQLETTEIITGIADFMGFVCVCGWAREFCNIPCWNSAEIVRYSVFSLCSRINFVIGDNRWVEQVVFLNEVGHLCIFFLLCTFTTCGKNYICVRFVYKRG